MHICSNEFLAGARLTNQQYAGVGTGHVAGLFNHALKGRTDANHAWFFSYQFAQPGIFLLQRRLLQSVFQDQEKPVAPN
jgi:hypothetical protein